MDTRDPSALLHGPQRRIMRFACALLLFRTTLFAAEAAKLPRRSARERIQYLRQARIWEPIDVASENLYDGPHRDLKRAMDQDVTCDFYPKPMGGFTEKFFCRLDDGRILKVKYDDGPQYKEAVSEVLGTRKNQGWSWRSLKHVDPNAGGATRAEIDALKLLNAFVQNSDNKAKQNALACPRDAIETSDGGNAICRRPILYVDDLGAVFGRGGFLTGYAGRADYEGWKRVPVWRNTATCTARLTSIGGIFRTSTLSNPKIGEAGRALLAAQLAQLSDAQIADLFRAARIETLHQTLSDGGSGRREVNVDDWVALFKAKRDEITMHAPCGEVP